MQKGSKSETSQFDFCQNSASVGRRDSTMNYNSFVVCSNDSNIGAAADIDIYGSGVMM